MGLGVVQSSVLAMGRRLNCITSDLIFKYLVFQVGTSMNFSRNWNDVKVKVKNRLSSWKSKVLSIGGKIALIKAVLGSIPVYYLSLYRAPVKVCRPALLSRGIINNASCSRWFVVDETPNHLLVNCGMTAKVWDGVFSWCKVPKQNYSSIKDLVELPLSLSH
ncbi:hypothetical protein QVD17_29183 [Tagetes erecta]|uniref:RNA-directed DNA polymerase, eukaryota n=1 Tax=Tagetes erecta TaxID=13708 RepID=A0AAD8NT90_TARER|nr:hypothetical protein QVD17_29183 [Tagetes erecta]